MNGLNSCGLSFAVSKKMWTNQNPVDKIYQKLDLLEFLFSRTCLLESLKIAWVQLSGDTGNLQGNPASCKWNYQRSLDVLGDRMWV